MSWNGLFLAKIEGSCRFLARKSFQSHAQPPSLKFAQEWLQQHSVLSARASAKQRPSIRCFVLQRRVHDVGAADAVRSSGVCRPALSLCISPEATATLKPLTPLFLSRLGSWEHSPPTSHGGPRTHKLEVSLCHRKHSRSLSGCACI